MLLLDLTSCFETSIELSSMLLFLWLCVLLFILTLPIIIIVHKPQMRWTCISDDDWWLGFHLWGSVDQWGHEHLSICVWDVNLVGYASQICIYINMYISSQWWGSLLIISLRSGVLCVYVITHTHIWSCFGVFIYILHTAYVYTYTKSNLVYMRAI